MEFLLFVATFLGGVYPAAADDSSAAPRSEEPRSASGENDAPREHFTQALVHYRAGQYQAAIVELEAALALDPTSKDLVYNLALVHEKLGNLSRAVTELERYETLETDPVERERAKNAVERIRGAEIELAKLRLKKPVPPPAEIVLPPPARTEPVDLQPLLLTTAGIAVAAMATGLIFGIRALALRPSSDPATTSSTGIEELRKRQARAEDSAIVADISFGVGLVSGAASTALFFHRSSRCPAQVNPSKTGLGVELGGRF